MRWAGAVAAILAAVTMAGRAEAGPAADDIRRAEAMIGVERYDRALAILKQVDVRAPEDVVRLDIALGRIFLGLGKASRALDFFEDAVSKSLDDAPARAGQAQCELALGRLADAARDARSALRSDDGSVAARLVLALVDERLGKRDDGDRMLATMAAGMPDSEDVAVARARFTSERNRRQAIAQLDDFVRAHPFAAAAEDALGSAQWAAGRRDIGLDHRRHAADLFAARGDTARAEAVRSWVEGAAGLPVDKGPEKPAPAVGRPVPVPVGDGVGAAAVDPNRPDGLGGIGSNFPTPFPFQPDGYGSGIVLEGGRYVLTNHHVVAGGLKFAVRNGLGQMQPARVLAVFKQADLALLEMTEPFPNEDGLPLSQIAAAHTGRRIMVMGFPIPQLMGDDVPSLTEGTVSKETGLDDDPTEFQMTARIEPGNSGGPIFDRTGELVGLSVAVLDQDFVKKALGHQSMNVSLGVSGARIAQFLKTSVAQSPSAAEEVDPERFYQQMQGRVVLIAAKIR